VVYRLRFAEEHTDITRRYFLGLGAAGLLGLRASNLGFEEQARASGLARAIAELEYLTRDEDFVNIGRGNPPPHQLPPERLREVGLVRETWQLEVKAEPQSTVQVERPLSRALGTALDWAGLMELAERRRIRILSVMSCTNVGAPCGMGLWEGIPLREVVWLAKPSANVRRLFYYGFHNNDPEQRFQSSLPIGRVLEDPPGEQPVLLCYKLNDQWLSSSRGGPVRMLLPGEYGNKSVKWLQHIVLTDDFKANDTYALWNNDTESQVKTCARFIHTPRQVKAGQPIPITGVAQVGMSGLAKVQYWLHTAETPWPEDDRYFSRADWKNADILAPPEDWGGGLLDGRLPEIPGQIDPTTGEPYRWPMRYTIVHWAALLTDVPPGQYDLRCRTIDEKGVAQPMPRLFPRSGHNEIQKVQLTVEA
jgi:DMSO/TMAO reductase YedYZ molybdopterin-dependent catalytic subunit